MLATAHPSYKTVRFGLDSPPSPLYPLRNVIGFIQGVIRTFTRSEEKPMLRRMLTVGTGLMLALVLAAPVLAQITTGTVTGTVKDSSGGVIPGATVVLISDTRGTRSAPAITSATGNYVFPNVTADTYTVEVTLEGFKSVRRTGVAVSGGDRVGVQPVTLEPGALAETVTVTAQSPLVQTQSGERSFAITSTQIENLPIARGNFTNLTAFTPGVVQNA